MTSASLPRRRSRAPRACSGWTPRARSSATGRSAPGWQAAPFLTADAAAVLGAVNASIVAGIATNLALLVVDPPWFKALGDVVVTTVGLVALAALWRTFPFSLGTDPVDWTRVVRVVLVVSIAGSVVAVVVGLVELVRSVTLPRSVAGDTGARS